MTTTRPRRPDPRAPGPVLRTERLALTPLAETDADALLDLFNTAEVGRYLLDGTPVTRGWVAKEVAGSRTRFDEIGCGLWAIRGTEPETDPSHLLGVVGYRPFFEPPELQLLYALRPAAWGRGLATEAATAALAHAFETLGFDEVRAATDRPNQASIRVLERLGMERWKIEEGEPWDTLFYRLRRARARRSTQARARSISSSTKASFR